MKQAPSVFVPTPPEGDGIALPTLLSVLAHGILIGFILYTHQTPKLESPVSIEATMISPEQLAEMQAQILSNRSAAMAANASAGNPDSADSTAPDTTLPSASAQSNDNGNADGSGSSSKHVPVFVRSNNAADLPTEEGILLSAEQRQALIEKRRAFQEDVDRAAAQFDEQVKQEQQQQRLALEEREQARLQRLAELKDIESKGVKIEPPKRPNTKGEDTGSAQRQVNISLSDGEPKVAGSTPARSAANGSSSSRSVGDYKNAIAARIQSKLSAPIETQGIKAYLFLQLDSKGRVLSVSVSGPNPQVNAAAEKAARSASPLPIDLSNPDSYSELEITVRVE